jgi:hypothetical protein
MQITINKLKRKAIKVLNGGTDWESKHEEKRKESMKWECKYNTLYRQLESILGNK